MFKIKSVIFNVVLGSYNLTLFLRGHVVKYFGYFIAGILALLLIGVVAFWVEADSRSIALMRIVKERLSCLFSIRVPRKDWFR